MKERNYSLDFTKGILILLVALGHNKLISEKVHGLYDFLYTFHVHGFFFISCLLPLTVAGFKRSFKKQLYVYFIFLTAYTIIYSFYTGEFSLLSYVKAIFLGTEEQIKNSSGFAFLWFLPSFIVFLCLRGISIHYKGLVRIFVWGAIISSYWFDSSEVVKNYQGFKTAIYIYALSELFVFIYSWLVRLNNKYIDLLIVLLSSVLAILIVNFEVVVNLSTANFNPNQGILIASLVMFFPIFAIYSIYLASLYFINTYPKSSLFFCYLGRNSLGVYLTHSITLQVFYVLFTSNSWLTAIAAFFVSVLAPLVILYLLDFTPRFKRIIFS